MIEVLRYDTYNDRYNHFRGGEELKIKINDTWLQVRIEHTSNNGINGWQLVFADVFTCKCSELEGYKIKPVREILESRKTRAMRRRNKNTWTTATIEFCKSSQLTCYKFANFKIKRYRGKGQNNDWT